jgi:hypothetical protein
VLNADRLGRKSEQEASGSEAPSLQRQNRRLRSGRANPFISTIFAKQNTIIGGIRTGAERRPIREEERAGGERK